MPLNGIAVFRALLIAAAPTSSLAQLAVTPATPQAQQRPARPLRIEPVAESLYLITGEGGNVAAYVTGEGVVLVDNMFYRNFEDMIAIVATVTDEPIIYALNTHQHDDHAGSNARMLAIADVVAHENVRVNLSDIRQPYYEDSPGTPIGLPNLTFRDTLELHFGAVDVRMSHLGRGHTNGDAVVQFPAIGVIHTGDLFLARAPAAGAQAPDRPRGVNIYVDYAQGGSFLEWSATLDAILALEFETIIPGHGPVSSRDDLVRFREDLQTMRDRIASLIASGASKEQVLAVFELDYGWRSTGCPPSPPTPGCLQYQQMDALIRELSP